MKMWEGPLTESVTGWDNSFNTDSRGKFR